MAVDGALARSPSQQDHELLVNVSRRVEGAIPSGGHGEGGGSPTRPDAEAVGLVVRRAEFGYERVAGLVIRDDLALFVGQRRATLGGAGEHTEVALLEIRVPDSIPSGARRDDRPLVEEIGEVRARTARRALCQPVEVDIVGERFATCVHMEDRPAAIGGGEVDRHMA
jgi:hypothetical protein